MLFMLAQVVLAQGLLRTLRISGIQVMPTDGLLSEQLLGASRTWKHSSIFLVYSTQSIKHVQDVRAQEIFGASGTLEDFYVLLVDLTNF